MLRCGTLNCQSLRNKVNDVVRHLLCKSIDICFLQETFMKDFDGAIVNLINEYGFDIYSLPRQDRGHGGLAVIHKPTVSLKHNKDKSNKKYGSFEYFESTLKTSVGLLRFCNIYRPPYSSNHRYTVSNFFIEFEEYLKYVALKSGYPVLTGDFNIHIENNNDQYANAFKDLMEQYDFIQTVPTTSATQRSGGTLDLVFVSNDIVSKIENIAVSPNGTPSDHYLVHYAINCKINKSDSTETASFRNFKMIDLDVFKKDLCNSRLVKTDVAELNLDELTELYNEELTRLLNKHCPVVKKKISKYWHKSKKDQWFDDEITIVLRNCRKAERKWEKSKLVTNKEIYKQLQKKYNVLVKFKRKLHHSNSFISMHKDKRRLFNKLNKLLGKEKTSLPNNDDHEKLSNDFLNYFNAKISTIRSHVDNERNKLNVNSDITCNASNSTFDCPSCNFDGEKMKSFKQLTLDDLKNVISLMNKKFCSLDPIPTWLLFSCSDILAPILLSIINMSLSTGYFPSSLKKAVIKPTIKNRSGNPELLSNYRPVSNIPFLSKLIEKIVLLQLDQHLTDNNLYCSRQSGYRRFHSCETLNISLFDNILKNIDEGSVVALLLLDMSAAFDTVDHSLLLTSLINDYGIEGAVLKWFDSYLENRLYCVNIHDCFSNFLCAYFGVPQGSILGPILFVLYTKHLQHIAMKHGLEIQLYADDTQLYIAFKPLDNKIIVCKTKECLNEIKHWLCSRYLKLNEEKTKLVLLCKPSVQIAFQQDKCLHNFCIPTDVCDISEENWNLNPEIKSLGVHLDQNLNMKKHISDVKKYCIGQLRSWRKITEFLNEEVRLMLVKQLLLSKIDYNNSLLIGIPNSAINGLQFIINCAIRFIYNLHYHEHVTPFIVKSHILPVKYRIDFKICLMVYNCMHCLAPSYLQHLLKWNTPTHSVIPVPDKTLCHSGFKPRTTQDPSLLVIPTDFGNRTKYRSRSFSHYAPRCWNKLPYDIRSCDCKETFKTKLKTYLFQEFISNC